MRGRTDGIVICTVSERHLNLFCDVVHSIGHKDRNKTEDYRPVQLVRKDSQHDGVQDSGQNCPRNIKREVEGLSGRVRHSEAVNKGYRSGAGSLRSIKAKVCANGNGNLMNESFSASETLTMPCGIWMRADGQDEGVEG